MSSAISIRRPSRLSSLAETLRFLQSLGKTSKELAHVFDATPDNVRQVISRYEFDFIDSRISTSAALKNAIQRFPWEQRFGWQELYGARRSRLEKIEVEIQRIWGEYASTFDPAGLEHLLPFVGPLSRGLTERHHAVRALLYQKIAWFHSHLGNSASSIDFGRKSLWNSLRAYNKSYGGRGNLQQFAETALIVSNSFLTSARPHLALRYLAEAQEALNATGRDTGIEDLRQTATAFLQLRENELSIRLFNAIERMMRGQASPEIAIQMATHRQRNLLQPRQGWDNAQQLVHDTKGKYGAASLEHYMAVNWGAAVSFLVDDSRENERGQEALESISRPQANAFGAQGTITYLLSVTPQLDLSMDELAVWVPFLLYQNAARTR